MEKTISGEVQEAFGVVGTFLSEHNYGNFSSELKDLMGRIEKIYADDKSVSSHAPDAGKVGKKLGVLKIIPGSNGVWGGFGSTLANPTFQRFFMLLMLVAITGKLFWG
jgi:hypothetical protein